MVQLLTSTMKINNFNLNTITLHLLAGLCGGADEAEKIYHFLDTTQTGVASPNAIAKLDWNTMKEFIKRCGDNSSMIEERHEKILIAVFTLISNVTGRSTKAANAFLRDYRPIELLFKLVASSVGIELKGAIFRALASLAKNNARETHEELWDMIETHRLLPIFFVGKDVLNASNGVSSTMSNNLTGVRLELEDSESKRGLYSITDGFLNLIEVLLSHGPQDSLGIRYRPPGIIVYLEYVISDVLLKTNDRYFCVGSQGKAQRWRLISRCLKILINVLQHYPINLLEKLQIQRRNNEQIPEDFFSDLEADFREETTSYTINEKLQSEQPRLKSAGFFVMSLLLSHHSPLRDQVVLLLRECGMPDLLESWASNYEAATKQALKMGEKLAQKTTSSSGLDNLLGFYGYEGGICDASYWQGRSVTTAMGLLYECALREAAFVRHFRSASYLTLLKYEQGRFVSKPVAIHNLIDSLSFNDDMALVAIIKLLNVTEVYNTSIPSIPIMATKILKKSNVDIFSSTKLWDTVNGQLAKLEGNSSMKSRVLDLQHACLQALQVSNPLPINEAYDDESCVSALGGDITHDVYSREAVPIFTGTAVTESTKGILNAAYSLINPDNINIHDETSYE